MQIAIVFFEKGCIKCGLFYEKIIGLIREYTRKNQENQEIQSSILKAINMF